MPAFAPVDAAAREAGSVRTGILVGCSGLFVLAAAAAGVIGYVVLRSVKTSTAYQMAVEEVRRNPLSREAIGEPIAEGFLTTGSVNVTPAGGEAKLHVEAVKQAGEWKMTLLQLDPPSGARIDLLAGAQQAALERGCEAGNAANCNTLGVQASSGTEGVWRPSRKKQDLPSANRWFGKACDLGSADGCANLAVAYENGWGVGKDVARAIALYEQSCRKEHAGACANLGSVYMGLTGAREDAPRAASLLERGCAGGVRVACSNLGVMHQRGWGVPLDFPRSAALYQQACDGGYALGCINLAELYVRGRGVPRDGARAAALFERACSAGDAQACERLSQVKGPK